jgi:hypothetical protein
VEWFFQQSVILVSEYCCEQICYCIFALKGEKFIIAAKFLTYSGEVTNWLQPREASIVKTT